MKTSFYFVLWILIYPLLGSLHNDFINNNSFFVALLVVWAVSWFLNRAMPHTLAYERTSAVAPVLEDVYTGNVEAFSKGLTWRTWTETVTAVYFCITAAVLIMSIFISRLNDWFGLIIFAFFAVGAMIRSVQLMEAKMRLRRNPTPEECADIAERTYKLNYAAYYQRRSMSTYGEMFPPKPRYYMGFQVFSIMVAIVAFLLGMWFIITSLIGIFASRSVEIGAMAGMYFLYGGLAASFGLKDIITILKGGFKKGA